jgi:hypothetical protein
VAKILNEGSVITVNFNASLCSDCQSANVLYYCNHICIIVINTWIYWKIQIFFYIYCNCQLTDNILYYCNYSCNIVCHCAYILHICLLIDILCILHPEGVPEWYCIHLNVINQIKAIWNWGCQPRIIQDDTVPNLTIFTQNVFKFVHVIISKSPSPHFMWCTWEKVSSSI